MQPYKNLWFFIEASAAEAAAFKSAAVALATMRSVLDADCIAFQHSLKSKHFSCAERWTPEAVPETIVSCRRNVRFRKQ